MPSRIDGRRSAILLGVAVLATVASPPAEAGNRGSLLLLPNIEIKWDADGNVTQDTLISLANEFPLPVSVQIFMVNGDPPTPPVVDAGGQITERAHPGWNRTACQLPLGASRTKFWSALDGSPGGCSFGILDAGEPPGRPDPENPSGRVLRGFMYVWAVNSLGQEINWNYLHADATITNFQHASAWSYQAQGHRALIGSRGDALPEPGVLRLDDLEFERPPGTLTFTFFAAGATVQGGVTLFIDTDLTLMPVSQDFRQDGDGCITTKARFGITNMQGSLLSGTEHCITCWDQSPLTSYGIPNHFLLGHLGSDIGTAVVDGLASFRCGSGTENAALIGVGAKITAFTTADWDQNGVVEVADFRGMAGCLNDSGPYLPPGSTDCNTLFDFDRDGDIDLRDVRQFPMASEGQRSYSTVSLFGAGSQSAVIYYDAPDVPE